MVDAFEAEHNVGGAKNTRPYMDQRLLRVQSPSTGAIQPYTNTHWMRARRSSDGIGVGMNINASLIMR